MASNNFAVSIDMATFGLNRQGSLCMLVLQRKEATSFAGKWALPGTLVLEQETFELACARRLKEAFNMSITYIEQLYSFGKPGRDPRGRTVSVTYLMLVPPRVVEEKIHCDSQFAIEARWVPVEEMSAIDWAFDHAEISQMALRRLRAKVRYEPILFHLLESEFSLQDAWRSAIVVCGLKLDNRNFAKRLKGFPFIVQTRKEPHRITKTLTALYRFDETGYHGWTARENVFNMWS